MFNELFSDLPKHVPLGVAVSGGSDSLALLYLSAEYCAQESRQLFAVTVDHGLRPESANEANWVHQVCSQLGVQHTTLKLGFKPTVDVSQDLARRKRHIAIYGWARQNDLSHILLGHTQDDCLETMIMRERSGSGGFGMAGPAIIGPAPIWPEGRGLLLCRPLLNEPRLDLMHWLKKRKQDWVSDPSNKNPRFERVRVRQEISTASADHRRRLINSLENHRMERCNILQQFASFLQRQAKFDELGAVHMSRQAYLAVPRKLQPLLLGLIAMAVGGSTRVPNTRKTAPVTEEISTSVQGARTILDSWVFWEDDSLTFCRRPIGEARSKGAPNIEPILLGPGDMQIWDGRFEATSAVNAPAMKIMSEEQASGMEATFQHAEDKPDGDYRIRRCAPVFVDDTNAAYRNNATENWGIRMNALVEERLFALVNERQATN